MIRLKLPSKIHFIYFYVYGTLSLAFGLLIIVNTWLLYPYKVITINTDKNIVNQSTLKQGETGSYVLDYCKTATYQVTKERYFVDGITYQVSTDDNVLPNGCRKILVEFTIPTTLPAGVYYIKTVAHYRVNPLRIITITQETTNFMVVENEAL
jgi:hypothetical protein